MLQHATKVLCVVFHCRIVLGHGCRELRMGFPSSPHPPPALLPLKVPLQLALELNGGVGEPMHCRCFPVRVGRRALGSVLPEPSTFSNPCPAAIRQQKNIQGLWTQLALHQESWMLVSAWKLQEGGSSSLGVTLHPKPYQCESVPFVV